MKRSRLGNIVWANHWLRVCLLSVSVVYLLFSVYVRSNHLAALERIEQQTRQQLSLNKASADAIEMYETYFPAYEDYTSRNLIGEADRLDWISTLDQLILSLGLPQVQFSLDKTRVSQEGETPFYLYDIPIYITDMSLNVTLLHEGDLLRLFDEYEARSKGTFSIERCEVARIDSTLEEDNYKGLNAHCRLRWFNLKDMYVIDTGALANVENK